MDETSPTILLSRVKELRHLLHSPGGEQQEQRVNTLAIFIARRAPNPSIRELAMRVMSEAAKQRRAEHVQNFDLNALLEQLRLALEEAAGKPRH